MSLNLDELELEPAEEFALELEPENLTAGDSANPSGALNTHGQTGSEANSADTLGPANMEAAAKNAGAIRQEAERPAVELNQSALMQVLPADFPLPTLIRFIPDQALRTAADQAAKYALSLEIREQEGIQRGDAACTALRTSLKSIDAHFEEPADIANRLHKQITGTRAEWCTAAKAALEVVGGRVAREQRRLQAEEQERRRKAQEEEDRKERERRRQEAEAAAKAKAPEPVVQELRRQAETATAPPVPVTAPATKLSGSSVVGTWKARLKGTSGEADPNPAIEVLTAAQKVQVMALLRAIVDAEHPLVGIQIDWSYWNKRAKADKSTLDAPGIEAFEDLGLRGKSSRSR